MQGTMPCIAPELSQENLFSQLEEPENIGFHSNDGVSDNLVMIEFVAR